jgi:hypothetical protein
MARSDVAGRRFAGTSVAPGKRAGKSVTEFCCAYDVSRSTVANWDKQGVGPAWTQPAGPGGRKILTQENEEEWQRRHTRRAASINDAAE